MSSRHLKALAKSPARRIVCKDVSFNGGNSFGDAACFEANVHHQNTYGRVTQPNNTSVSRTTSYQCQNMAEMSIQDVHKDTESDDDFMNMINRTLK